MCSPYVLNVNWSIMCTHKREIYVCKWDPCWKRKKKQKQTWQEWLTGKQGHPAPTLLLHRRLSVTPCLISTNLLILSVFQSTQITPVILDWFDLYDHFSITTGNSSIRCASIVFHQSDHSGHSHMQPEMLRCIFPYCVKVRNSPNKQIWGSVGIINTHTQIKNSGV